MRLVAFLVVFGLLGSSVYAQGSAVMPLVLKNYGGTRTINAAFDLSIYWDVREREEKKAGELITAPGDKFKVTIGKDIFVSDGKTYWQYNERNAQVVVRHFADIDPSTLPSAMLSSFLSNREFKEMPVRNNTADLVWSGNGAAASDGYKEISVNADSRNGIINVLKMKDGNDNIHTYTFKKAEFDKPVKNDMFQFKAPRGVEVVDMRDN